MISEGNYNLFKISEVTYKSRLQNDSSDITSSNNINVVSGWIPVKYGKFYTASMLIDGSRVASYDSGKTSIIPRIIAKRSDGTMTANIKTELISSFNIPASRGTFGITTADIVAVRLQINTPINCDISTAEKLKTYEIMLVEGNTAEEAYSKACSLEYIDGDTKIEDVYKYSIKNDSSKADKTYVDRKISAINQKVVNTNYGDNMLNDRFIKSILDLMDEKNKKEFEINITNNSGKTIRNASIVVGLHNTVGINPEYNNMPFQIYDDVFSKPVGVKFFDGITELPFYIESESECNYITDKNVKTSQKSLAVFPNGKIAVYNEQLQGMQISSDDGATWTNICSNITGLPYRILLPDSQNNLFVASVDGYKLYKYTSADNYKSGTEVIDMSSIGTKIGSILAEDDDGNLYLGTYQLEFHCTIRKSTDHGDTWTVVFDVTNCQHVHNIFVNKKVTPNEIFIGLDNSSPDTVETWVSKDAGATWNKVPVPYGNRDYAFRYAGENFYIGCGERLYLGGSTLYKTTDYNDPNAYYPLFDNGQGVRDIINVIENKDDVLIAGGCADLAVNEEHLFLSEDRGETWKTVLIRPYHSIQNAAGKGLRTFSRKGNQILSQTSSDYAMRFVYGNGAKTVVAIVNVGDIPVSGKTITLKTGYIANIEQIKDVLTSYEKIDGKVADINICDGYVIDTVSNKRVMTDDTEISDSRVKIGLTSEYKILKNYAYCLNGSVNLGKLSRLNFTKGFTVSILFRKEDGKNYLSDNKYHVIFQSGNTRLALWYRSLVLLDDKTSIFGKKMYIKDPYLESINKDYIRITAYFTNDDRPTAGMYTENSWYRDIAVQSNNYSIAEELNRNDFIIGNSSTDSEYDSIPNISRIEIYNRVLSHGEIMSLTNGCNLVSDGSTFN